MSSGSSRCVVQAAFGLALVLAHGCELRAVASTEQPLAKAGGPGGPCYGNKTCDDGLTCDAAKLLCVGALAGQSGGPCFPNKTCFDGMTCAAGTCVAAADASAQTGDTSLRGGGDVQDTANVGDDDTVVEDVGPGTDEPLEGGGGYLAAANELPVSFGAGDCVGPAKAILLQGVPWISQVPPGGWYATMNCGPASYAMVEGYLQKAKPTAEKIKAIDDWLAKNVSGWKLNGYNGNNTGTTTGQLAQLAKGFGNLSGAATFSGWTCGQLAGELSKGNPVIVTVDTQGKNNYPSTKMTPSNAGHFMVAVGMDGDSIWLLDPGRSSENNGCGEGCKGRKFNLQDFYAVWSSHARSGVSIPPAVSDCACGDGKCNASATCGESCSSCEGDCGCSTEQKCDGGKCVVDCAAMCAGKQCGTPNGCPCGPYNGGCQSGYACSSSACVQTQQSACEGKECGTYSGFDCGACAKGYDCNAGKCAVNQAGACLGKECGNFSGFACGTCQSGYDCSAGKCVINQTGACSGKECGNYSGYACGTCGSGYDCNGGKCVLSQTGACAGKQCGTYSGFSCGTCNNGYDCNSGKCVLSQAGACAGKECGNYNGFSCGDCGNGYDCNSCKCLQNQSGACAGKECGNFGGFSCGTCESGFDCKTGTCVANCAVLCASNQCGTVGGCACGNYGGGCQQGYTCSGTTCQVDCNAACSGKQCGSWNGCSCGSCGSGYTCSGNSCVDSCSATTWWNPKSKVVYMQGVHAASDPLPQLALVLAPGETCTGCANAKTVYFQVCKASGTFTNDVYVNVGSLFSGTVATSGKSCSDWKAVNLPSGISNGYALGASARVVSPTGYQSGFSSSCSYSGKPGGQCWYGSYVGPLTATCKWN